MFKKIEIRLTIMALVEGRFKLESGIIYF